jgi:hypothetical protein
MKNFFWLQRWRLRWLARRSWKRRLPKAQRSEHTSLGMSDEPSSDALLALGFISHPIRDGGTYTLTTYLGLFLREAEKLAGPRDRSWTILGVEFFGEEREGAVPHNWYPGNCGQIAIRLTHDVAKDFPRAIFQLAHEVVHLISPSGGRQALNLEEGFATIFGHAMAEQHANFSCVIDNRYRAARDDVRALFEMNPLAIREIRQLEPRLWMATPEIVARAVPGIDTQLAARLCCNWYATGPAA